MRFPLIWMKVKRALRRSPEVAWRNFYSAFVNRDQFIAFLIAVTSTILVWPRLREQDLINLSEGWWASIQAVFWVACIWAVWCLITAPLWSWLEDRRKGRWYRNRFVYYEPLLLKTFRCSPTGNVEMHKFRIRDVEPGASINFAIELDGGHNLAEIGLGGTMLHGPIPYRNWPGTGGVLLPKSREAIFQIRLPTNALSITARIYCRDYIVGEHNEQDGTPGNYQFPVRPNVASAAPLFGERGEARSALRSCRSCP